MLAPHSRGCFLIAKLHNSIIVDKLKQIHHSLFNDLHDIHRNVTSALCDQLYNVATDGNNDMEDVKLYLALIEYFDNNLALVLTVLLCMAEYHASNGLKI